MFDKNEFLTAREVSKLLKINEKKVYYLAQQGNLPGTKITGKWIFPATELERHIREKARIRVGYIKEFSGSTRCGILVSGSDDPSIYLAQGIFHTQNPNLALFYSHVGSSEGIRLLQRGVCQIALSHIYDSSENEYNFSYLRKNFTSIENLVVVNVFSRMIGFISRNLPVKSFVQAKERRMRFINRQEGSGIRFHVDRLLNEEGLTEKDLTGYESKVYTHFDVVLSILRGEGDVGVGCEAVARYAGLHFYPVLQERFDMITYKELFFEKNIQAFLDFIHSSDFTNMLKSMGGYDTSTTGRIIYPGEK